MNMGEKNFKKHCPRCKKETPCKRRHVYAMELENTVNRGSLVQDDKSKLPNWTTMRVRWKNHPPPLMQAKHAHKLPRRGLERINLGLVIAIEKRESNACNYGKPNCSKACFEIHDGLSKTLNCTINSNPQRGPSANSAAEYEPGSTFA